jgi:hypothetical protein
MSVFRNNRALSDLSIKTAESCKLRDEIEGNTQPEIIIVMAEKGVNNSFYSSSNIAPSLVAGNDIGLTSTHSFNWSLNNIAVGTHAPSDISWGNFLTVRPDPANQGSWIEAGYTLQGANTKENIQPVYFYFKP